MRVYEDVFRLAPRNVTALIRSGALLSNIQDKVKEAEARFRAALSLDPENVTALANLAIVLRRQNELHEARQVYLTYRRRAEEQGEPPMESLSDLAEAT